MNKKPHDMAVFIEFVAGSGLAIFFHFVLHNEDDRVLLAADKDAQRSQKSHA